MSIPELYRQIKRNPLVLVAVAGLIFPLLSSGCGPGVDDPTPTPALSESMRDFLIPEPDAERTVPQTGAERNMGPIEKSGYPPIEP